MTHWSLNALKLSIFSIRVSQEYQNLIDLDYTFEANKNKSKIKVTLKIYIYVRIQFNNSIDRNGDFTPTSF